MKATASYKGNIVAETDHYEIVDGNVYVRLVPWPLIIHMRYQANSGIVSTKVTTPSFILLHSGGFHWRNVEFHTHLHCATIIAPWRRNTLQIPIRIPLVHIKELQAITTSTLMVIILILLKFLEFSIAISLIINHTIGNQETDAAWYYPLSKISSIEGYVAFCECSQLFHIYTVGRH